MRQALQPAFFLNTATTHYKAVQLSCENASTYPDAMQKPVMHPQLSGQQ